MPRIRSNGPANRRRRQSASSPTAGSAAPVEAKPVRGMKLKHVSTITTVAAFLCLFAYLAGRVDVSAATGAPGVRSDDAKERMLLCLDAATGKVLWTRTASGGPASRSQRGRSEPLRKEHYGGTRG